MSDRRHAPDLMSRPRAPICAPPPPRRVALPPLKAPPAKAVTLRPEAPLIGAGQGRTSQEARASAEAMLVLAMSVGVVALVVACGWIVEALR